MHIFTRIRTFHDDENGAVSVDWVVLTAAIIGLAIAALGAVKGGVASLSDRINSYMSSQTIASTF
jgi:Flp pilus assembly pilin Flp